MAFQTKEQHQEKGEPHKLEQALLKVIIVLALIAHEFCNGTLALAQLAQAEGAKLVQLPAQQKNL